MARQNERRIILIMMKLLCNIALKVFTSVVSLKKLRTVVNICPGAGEDWN
jgi:hypothetical protein